MRRTLQGIIDEGLEDVVNRIIRKDDDEADYESVDVASRISLSIVNRLRE
jgi:hypothetical protein